MTGRAWTRGMGAAAAAAAAALVTGCFVGSSSSGSSSGYAGGPPAYDSGSPQPMLVVVDTGGKLTMTEGGGGVGVFTTYDAGGHWHVWWTCDTSVTGLGCQFNVNVSVATGTIANVGNQLSTSGSQLVQPSDAQIVATTATTTAIDGVVFDTTPGATITLEAGVNGADSGAFLFFVQDGMVNGGYKGTLSDPITYQPSSP